jgi:hypothetical protein
MRVVGGAPPQDDPVPPPGERTAREAAFLRAHGRMPTPGEAEALGREVRDDELLFREALARGLHESDPVVVRRLVRNMRFAAGGEGASSSDESQLLREALALGMHRSDLVVRRRLVQRMKLLAAEAAREREPGEAELEATLAAHAERFARPARLRLWQVFLSRERRGARLERDAARLLAVLRRDPPDARAVESLGDPFLHPARLPSCNLEELGARFGERFADGVSRLPLGSWQGPLPSAFGLHLVLVREREPARPARGRQLLAQELSELRQRAGAARD